MQQNRSSLYSLQYRLSRGPAKEAVGPALPPGSPGRMQQFHFSAIETPYGSLKVRSSLPLTAVAPSGAVAPSNSALFFSFSVPMSSPFPAVAPLWNSSSYTLSFFSSISSMSLARISSMLEMWDL